MILYHVTFDLNSRGIFHPRVPENAHDYDENEDIPRICFSTTLNGCLASLPRGGLDLRNTLKETNGIIKVFQLDTHKYGIPLSSIVPPMVLHTRGYVDDAWATMEYWLLQSIQFRPEDIHYLKVLSFDNACMGKHGVKPPSQYESGDVDVILNLRVQEIPQPY